MDVPFLMWRSQEGEPKEARKRSQAPVGEGILLHASPYSSTELGWTL